MYVIVAEDMFVIACDSDCALAPFDRMKMATQAARGITLPAKHFSICYLWPVTDHTHVPDQSTAG